MCDVITNKPVTGKSIFIVSLNSVKSLKVISIFYTLQVTILSSSDNTQLVMFHLLGHILLINLTLVEEGGESELVIH